MPDQDPTRRRLLGALSQSQRRQVAVALLLAVLGFAYVVQARGNHVDDTYADLRESELIQVYDGLTGTAEKARREVARLEARRDELQDESGSRSAALDEARQRLNTLNIIGGLVPVSGPGLRVTITDSNNVVTVGALLDTVQELRTAGAEAMEFNDTYRLGAQSSFENTDDGMLLEGQPLKSPYVIDVIGDQHVLQTALTFSSGPVETLQAGDGVSVSIQELDTVEIKSIRPAFKPEFAEPVGGP